MTKTIVALAATLFASSLFAGEEIYIYSSYKNSEGNSISHKIDCRDSKCKLDKDTKEQSTTLTKAQRDQILAAFQAETKRFDLKSTPKPGDRLIKIKFRYHTDRDRLQLSRRLADDQLAEVSPEMAAVLKNFLEFDISDMESMEPAAGEEKPMAAAGEQKKY